MNHSNYINKICAVIPFYNEEKFIEQTFLKVSEHVDFIIAVNDGSTDTSLEKIKNIPGVIILQHKKNKGKGYALKTGLKKSIELKTKYTITLDADMQHVPEYIPEFIYKLKKYDAVIGNRLHDRKGMPLQRKLSNFLTSKILSIKTGSKVLDSQSGYRAFRTEILKDILPESNGFEAESEMIIKLLKAAYSLGFVDIPTIYNEAESKMKSVQAIAGFIKVVLKKY